MLVTVGSPTDFQQNRPSDLLTQCCTVGQAEYIWSYNCFEASLQEIEALAPALDIGKDVVEAFAEDCEDMQDILQQLHDKTNNITVEPNYMQVYPHGFYVTSACHGNPQAGTSAFVW